MGKTNRIKDDMMFSIINGSLLALILIIVLYPLIYILSSSFSSTTAVANGKVWLLPVQPSLSGYRAIFENKDIVTGFINSIYYTIIGTAVNLFFTLMAAYPLSRKDLRYRNPVMLFYSFTMFFSGGMIPSFLLVRNLGLLNTVWAITLPGAVNVYNLIIARQFFASNIPTELLEASKLDGCSDIMFVIKVVLPLSGAIIAVLGLFFAVGHWNNYFSALLYLKKRSMYPLQVFLREILIQNTISGDMTNIDVNDMEAKIGLEELLKYSLIVVSSFPVMCIYPFVQKFFVKGVMIGSIKG